MQLITTTQLRTQTNKLVKALEAGREISVVHRSKIIGAFVPQKEVVKKFDSASFKKIIEKLKFTTLSNKEMGKKYREAMNQKHGQNLL